MNWAMTDRTGNMSEDRPIPVVPPMPKAVIADLSRCLAQKPDNDT
jgi:hypothetical protein